jgi:hypothetical protein
MLQRELAEQRSRLGRTGPSYEETKIVERLAELLSREEVMWRQRSQIQWLSEGDRNTSFFHLRACQRKRRNKISELTKQDGIVLSDEGEMGRAANDFYQHLYASEGVANMDQVLNCVPRRVGEAMNRKLDAPFSAKEVKDALFEMYPTKVPGPDGFPAHFFQRHWDVCGEEVTLSVLIILKGQDTPEIINKTFIVLIPKVASPKELGEFRPISLCNVIYKVASKVATNRLKGVLP